MMALFHVQLAVFVLGLTRIKATSLHIFQPNRTVANSSCGMSCKLLGEIGPPPDLILTIPPPPLPSSFNSMHDTVQLSAAGEKCNFCDWALSGSGDIPIHKKAGYEDNSWVVISVIIIVLSSIFGFALILVILQCNNIKIFPVSETCPILAGSSSAKKSPPKVEEKPSPALVRKEQVRPLVHLWHQGGSQEKPLQTPSSQCSEANSYSGEPYRCESVDSQPVYSEINIRSETSSTIYSEVIEPPPLPPVVGPLGKLLSDGAYENAAFNTCENNAAAQQQNFRLPKPKKPRLEPVDDPVRQESPYYYKQPDQQLPARKPLPLLPSHRMRSLPRRPLPNTPPSPAMV